MRGGDERTGSLFSYVDLEARVPAGHPLRAMRRWVNASLEALDGSFDGLYAKTGRPSIAPERLLRAVLLQMLYSIRSELQLMERLEFDLLFRWFVGLGIDDADQRDGEQDGQGAQNGCAAAGGAKPGYAISLRCRKRIEEVFGWVKTTSGLAQLKVRGLDKVEAVFTFALAAYNIVRLPKLIGSTGEVCLAGGK
jgi:hypothetical protein